MMIELTKLSNWISIKYKTITPRHSLYCYADNKNKKYGYLCYFVYKNKEYALSQFVSRFGAWGFDKNCNMYPSFIDGYYLNGNKYEPLYCEISNNGDKIRLYTVKKEKIRCY